MRKFSQINEKTNPWYAKGQIIACFKSDVDDKVVDYFLKKLKLKRRDYHFSIEPGMEMTDSYIIDVPQGEEDKYIKLLQSNLKDEIEWVDRRNLKFELRAYTSSFCAKELQSLSEDTEISDQEWKERSEKVIDILKMIAVEDYTLLRGTYKEFDKKFNEL